MRLNCPNCSRPIDATDATVACPSCGALLPPTTAPRRRWWRLLLALPILYALLGVGAVIRQMMGAAIRQSPEFVRALPSGSDAIRCLAFHPDGNRLAAAAGPRAGELTLWDCKTSRRTLSIAVGADLYSVAFSPDGQRLATNARNNEIKLWDAATARELSTLRGHTGFIWSVTFSPDGGRLASSSDDRTVRVWDAAAGKTALVLSGHTGAVFHVAFSADGRHVASASDDGTIRIWETTSGRLVRTLSPQRGAVVRVQFSPDGVHLASAAGGVVQIWEATTGQLTRTLGTEYGTMVNDIIYSADGRRLAAACNPNRRDRPPGVLIVWDVETGKEFRSLHGHTAWPLSVVFLGDSERLASGDFGGSVLIWDMARQPLKK